MNALTRATVIKLIEITSIAETIFTIIRISILNQGMINDQQTSVVSIINSSQIIINGMARARTNRIISSSLAHTDLKLISANTLPGGNVDMEITVGKNIA